MSRQEAIQQFRQALKAGQKCYRECVHRGRYPYPQVLEERGEYCSLELPSGTVCILDGGLFVYRQAGEPEYLEFPERPACMVPVGENTLVITARTALYRVRL